ncbi:DUF3809 domain-containing protein [Deinococcus radiodurans]|uniref:DUF3809 domain-containing protein n=2 Tax=Deinococcus radiodurans TaxID=1299 RepID=Q9RSW5_DEIRA|nr:DUF3809 domain-containing protein [Deinococcus radiodurans]AAF11566.1 hypothetical protein DR_2006 [Deinococcus radiodurans R1 = ATCC 13939 = DSM 20539]ANC70918.1 hypothetical protein A2G07_03600 [Deinococcus radiodurans R1 = ATCC 13939 = DSM 20539]QEM71401.1 DUF3809 domain-containing protein [Deinococcus radiodurans]QIP29938.1 DUF3809 family protein [Deinococcus radiodurans]QIP31385.1 DUF3809 family protein [Deinococcus radiodurans]
MILSAEQSFTLRHPHGQAAALAFVREPAAALAGVRFLRGLDSDGEQVWGELLVTVPLLGEVDLPFRSEIVRTPQGAELRPLTLTGERAWVAVSGQATAAEGGEMAFAFQFQAHLATPEAEGWGGAAFEKMVQAAAGRTLERVAKALPEGLAAGLPPA